ncbi:MAG: cytochrome P450 [Steroidobacteraceae bacterium]
MTVANYVPAHVKQSQVVPVDIYFDARFKKDLHLGWHSLHADAPDIFFTPFNGGHWVVTRFDLMSTILRDSEHFSNRELDIPASNSPNVMIPLNLDPPDHTPYRIALMAHFDRKSIVAMEPKLRAWASRLIDRVLDQGGCDFTETLGAGFPVSVFMEMSGLPLDRFEEFRKIAVEYFGKTTIERRIELQNIIVGLLTELIEARQRERKDDLISKLIDADVRGRRLTLQELQSMGFLLFIAGLDTVANALTFAYRHLAEDTALQDRLRQDPAVIPDFVEESLRRYAVVNQTRIVKKDIDFAGASFRTGDMVLCPLTLGGMDERKNPTPERFDLDRQKREHITFSIGPHVCLGNVLARAEMRIFTEEWVKRIPRFQIAAGSKPEWRAGLVMALMHLPLQWPASRG